MPYAVPSHVESAVREFAQRHSALFDRLDSRSAAFCEYACACLSETAKAVPRGLKVVDLERMAAEVRQTGAEKRIAASTHFEPESGGECPYDAFAGIVEAYLREIGHSAPTQFGGAVGPAGSRGERIAAEQAIRGYQVHALDAVDAELACNPPWRRDLIMAAGEAAMGSLAIALPAIVWTETLKGLGEFGPANLFRVLIRHHAGTAPPPETPTDELAAVARAEDVLRRLGLTPRAARTASTAHDALSEGTRDALGVLARSFAAWMAEKPGRSAKPVRYPIHLPLEPGVGAELVDAGIVAFNAKGVVLTELGAAVLVGIAETACARRAKRASEA